MIRFTLAVVMGVAATSPSFSQPPPGFFPPGMPNAGDLWIEFCNPVSCTDREAQIWGQVCDSEIAKIVVNGPKENASYMPTPLLSHYAGWRCGRDGELITPDRNGYFNDGKFVSISAE
jgi:hypothetical protein